MANLDMARLYRRVTSERVWEWEDRWGPSLGDVTKWSVLRTRNRVTVRVRKDEFGMSVELAKQLIAVLQEAVVDEPDPVVPTLEPSGEPLAPDGGMSNG